MRKAFSPLIVVVVAVVAVATLVILVRPDTGSQRGSKPAIAASVYPLYDIARNIAGDDVDVLLILPPGSSPHAYEPRPSDVRKIDGAASALTIGHGLDAWMETLAEASGTELVTVDRGIAIREMEGHDEEEHEDEGHDDEEMAHGHSHEDGDPHYWLSIPNAKIIAQNVADELARKFPAHAKGFAARLAQYLITLDETDRGMRDALKNVTNRKLVTMHDAWYYFAAEYGLEIVGSFEPTAGREPTPQYLVELKEAVKAANATTLYTEPLIATTSIQSFIKDNGLMVAMLDPVEGAAGENHTYAEVMYNNAVTVASHQSPQAR